MTRPPVYTLIPTKKLDKIGDLSGALKQNVGALEPILSSLRRLENNGNAVVLLHKLGDYKENEEIIKFKSKTVLLNNIIWIDDPLKAQLLSNRWKIHLFLESLELPGAKLPKTTQVDKGTCSFSEPSVIKPEDACGDVASHRMLYLPANTSFTPKGKRYIRQPFIEHGSVMWKLYVIGRHVTIIPRPSLSSQEGSVYFSSQGLKASGTLENYTLLESAMKFRLENLALFLSTKSELRLLGVDVLIDVNCDVWVIDLNYFPGYDGVEDVPGKLADCIYQVVDLNKNI